MKHRAEKYYQDNFEIIQLNNDAVSAEIVVNIGNTLFSLKQRNKEKMFFPYTLNEYKSNAKLAGNPFMHPWANRLEDEYIHIENKKHVFPKQQTHVLYRDGNDLPLHGLLLKSAKWKTIEVKEEENTCYHIAESIFDDDDLLSIFPFRHRIQMKHVLQNNTLSIETSVWNEDEKPMPVSFGYHPYFCRTQEKMSLTIPANDVIEVNDKMIPTGNTFDKSQKWNFKADETSLENNAFDDGFQNLKFNKDKLAIFSLHQAQPVENENLANHRIELANCPPELANCPPELVNRQAELVEAVEAHTEHVEVLFNDHYLFAQIYAPANPGKPYVCIEPMTAATNALNTNTCKTILKKEKFTATFSIRLPFCAFA